MKSGPHVAMLEIVANKLSFALDSFVFVGGAIADLLHTEAGTSGARATYDVDTVVQVNSRIEYQALEGQLRQAGLIHDPEVICRWVCDGVRLDVMPTEPEILGFSNPWYATAHETAISVTLPSGRAIRVIDGPHFLATKLSAFVDRGKGDLFASHDLEDIIALVDTRPELKEEFARSHPLLRNYCADQIASLLGKRLFREAVEGHLGALSEPMERVEVVLERLKELSLRKEHQ